MYRQRTKIRHKSVVPISRSGAVSAEGKFPLISLSENAENTCLSENDIPGFYYDAQRKRYFRLLPGNNNHNPLTSKSIRLYDIEKLRKTKSSRRHDEVPECHPRTRSLCSTIMNRQNGATSSSGFCRLFQKERMSNFKCVKKAVVKDVIELPAETCKYLYGRPEDGMFIGAWYSENKGLVIHSLSLETELSDSENILCAKRGSVVNIHPTNLQLADVCVIELYSGLLFALYAGNSVNEGKTSIAYVHLLPIRSHCDSSTAENREHIDKAQNYEFLEKHVWSCCFNDSLKAIFMGGEGYISKLSIEDSGTLIYKVPNEKIFSLTANRNGQMLYAGTNTGYLKWFDTRSTSEVGCLKIGHGSSYLKLLTDETKLLVSSYDDNLVQVDLREKKAVFAYPNHNNEHRKLPFSVDELSNILCSVGQDGITRFWSLHEGKMLTSILPPETCAISTEISEPLVWYSDNWNIHRPLQARKSCLVVAAQEELFFYSP